MNKLQLPQAKLLYAIGEAYRRRKIDESEKRILKQKIITDNVQIFELLEQTDDQNVLIDKLAYLVKSNDTQNNIPPINPDIVIQNQPEQASSPWGEFLRRRKINTQHQHKNEAKEIRSIIHPQKTE